MIERVHLTILQQFEKQGTLTKAAEALNLTQSALSHAIHNLEVLSGVKLWDKEGRNIRLTQAGQYLLEMSHQILPQMEDVDRRLKRYASGKQGHLRIGMECHPCYEWMLTVVEPFLKRWPDVDVDVIQRFQFSGFDALCHHNIDMLITPDPIKDARLIYEAVFEYELVLVCAKEHPLAKLKKPLMPKDLLTQRLYTYPVSQERLDVFTQFLIPAHIQPEVQQVEATEIMLQLVAAGRGVCTLPDWLARKYRKTYALQVQRLGRKGVHKNLHIGYRKTDAESLYLQNFVALSRRKVR